MKFSAETEVVEVLRNFLIDKGFETTEEVSSMGQSIDLVGKKSCRIYAFEAKRDNWKRGLAQCKAHELIADYVCLAMGSKSIPTKLVQEVESLGYGLVWCNPEDSSCQWVHEPKINKNIWPPQKQLLMKNLKEQSQCQ
ncbi:hypothetical protein A7D25_22615 [Pseudomonas sp. 21C1]|uniref:hypothetical protein n=1 Tax=Pseudomonas TaxID=286 RepID=UPI00084A86CE|nr:MULTISPECIES: hypothetical protein [Pseudomonas]OEC32726.1 hypothetical protein A7D25_22615 [Pseudomonas sp. 21C1]